MATYGITTSGPCECCGAECPTVTCDACSGGVGSQNVFLSADKDVVWGGGVVMGLDPTDMGPVAACPGTLSSSDGTCIWGAEEITGCDTAPIFSGISALRWEKLYKSGGDWLVDLDWVVPPGYTPSDYLLTYRLDSPFSCCSTSQTISVTRIAGPSGSVTVAQEPATLTFVSCGCGMMAAEKMAALSLPLARPDRCAHLGKRTEFRSGCGGMNCRWSCDLNLPAVPSVYCQTCSAYVAEPGEPWIG